MDRSFVVAARKRLLRRSRLLTRSPAAERTKRPVLSDEDKRELGEIHAALERIERGVYGRCDGCFEAVAAVRLEAIAHPLLMLVADQDHLVPPASTLALRDRASSLDPRSISIDTGHIGLAVSSRAHRQLWPEAANWIADHSTELE